MKDRIVPGEFYPEGFIAEECIQFDRELSFIAARSFTGEVRFYAPAENTHHESVLVSSVAPAKDVSTELIESANNYLLQIMNELQYVGVMAMECFHLKRDSKDILLVNELAPRVHNSGHWTQAGCMTSQFENHLRAILGLNLGSTDVVSHTAMVNVLGHDSVDLGLLAEDSSLHWYNKECRNNRKMGHINIVRKDADYEGLLVQLEQTCKNLRSSTKPAIR